MACLSLARIISLLVTCAVFSVATRAVCDLSCSILWLVLRVEGGSEVTNGSAESVEVLAEVHQGGSQMWRCRKCFF